VDGDRRARLSGWLSDALGRAVEIGVAERIGTGHAHEMWVVVLRDEHLPTRGDPERLVVRIEQSGVFATSVVDEARWVRALRDAGVPVPEIVAVDGEGDALGRPTAVSRFVEGADAGISSDVADDLIRHVDHLHRVGDQVGGARLPAVDQVEHWAGVAGEIEVVPLIDETRRWLLDHRPRAARTDAPVHGDVGPGNLVHDGRRVVALTDWEFAHLGDPAEDWVFLATVRGARVMPVEGWRRRIDELTGWRIPDAEWRYWEVLNHFKGACANLTALPIFESGHTPSVDMLTVATALHHHFLARAIDIVHGDPPLEARGGVGRRRR